ncbi:hypothetical protein BDD12DRAFT_806150 [Trichophaea hybrida]|nr:hypothetical protein BDD12DRAFT_806150 [Trichophaea hybrida]
MVATERQLIVKTYDGLMGWNIESRGLGEVKEKKWSKAEKGGGVGVGADFEANNNLEAVKIHWGLSFYYLVFYHSPLLPSRQAYQYISNPTASRHARPYRDPFRDRQPSTVNAILRVGQAGSVLKEIQTIASSEACRYYVASPPVGPFRDTEYNQSDSVPTSVAPNRADRRCSSEQEPNFDEVDHVNMYMVYVHIFYEVDLL